MLRSMLVLFLLTAGAPAFATSSLAEANWTVMIYMNGKNNLENDALNNFQDIAQTGSSAAVNLLVEMGRPKEHITDDFGGWSGVLRFLVQKDMEPTPASAITDLTKIGENTDMGSPETLS